MKYRLRDIENFVTLSECRTLTEGAGKLGITQPALSESLKHLEKCNAAPLFYRSRVGVRLSPEGRKFLPRAKQVLQCFDALSDSKDPNQIFGDRKIRIGCHQTVALYSLPKIVKKLAKVAPDYQLELKHDLSRNIHDLVARGELDLGLVINPLKYPDLVIRNVFKDEVSIWQGRSGSSETLFCNLDLFQTQSILRKWKEKPARIIHTDSLALISKFLGEGLGRGILPSQAVKLSGEKLKMLPGAPKYQDTLAVIYRPEFGKAPAEKCLLEIIKTIF